MGFFFSRKSDLPEDTASSKENGKPAPAHDSGSMAKSLRSRFQGYAKKLDSKERDLPPTLFVQATTVAETLSAPLPTPIATRHLELKLKLSTSSPALNAAARHDRSKNPKPSSPENRRSAGPMQTTDTRPPASRSRALGTKSSSSSLQMTSDAQTRKPTDSVTATLAQRLNELAVANSEGLLNDDEYRLLRQDLFHRFSSTTAVPTETPIVPLAAPSKSKSTARINGVSKPVDKRLSMDSRRVSISASSSNFFVEKKRTPSMHSRSSMTSGVASLFRRATGRSSSHDYSDASSVFSATSAAPSESTNRYHRLSKKTSGSSLRTDRGDAVSISSRQATGTTSLTESPNLPGGSVRSVRRLPTPPSSFPTNLPGVESRYVGAGSNSPSEETPILQSLQTAAAIRQEMLSVEAEGRRLMDAFSGLELRTLTQRRRSAVTGPRDSVATLVPDGRSARSFLGRSLDAERDDAASMRSGTSAGASSRRSTRKAGGPSQVQSTSRASSLHRKTSVSSVTSSTSRLGIGGNGSRGGSTSGSTSGNGGLTVPPVPPLPLGMSLGIGSTPSLRSSGHLPMGVVHEDAAVETDDVEEEREFGLEMEELRRRREEVHTRYEARLEYLRAKLKGAELHEKLLSK
ncbi:hypothetical protein C8J57DRAFT_1280595 [Mycena rebaudengoi]|nr:hypothetical protein C8J57DRAFT_1280595 [Mycena rebaudengoi]